MRQLIVNMISNQGRTGVIAILPTKERIERMEDKEFVIEIVVRNRCVDQFRDVCSRNNAAVIKEAVCTESDKWMTVKAKSIDDIYWIGREYEQIIYQPSA